MQIAGNWATVLLPIQEDDAIDWRLLARELDALVAAGVSGAYSNGTAGEFFTLTEAEYERTSAMLAAAFTAAGIPFQIGASHFSAQTMLERIRVARSYGPAAIQVVLPDWFPVKNSEAITFLRRAAEVAGEIPLVIYNPPHAKQRLTAADWAEILPAVPQVASIKVPDGDSTWYEAMQPVMAMTAVFVPGHHLATGVAHGAKGSYSNMAALHPAGAQRWYELMLTDLPEALRQEGLIRQFMDECITPLVRQEGYPNFAVDKYLCVLGDWCEMPVRVRFPYRSIPLDRLEQHRARLKELAPFLLEG